MSSMYAVVIFVAGLLTICWGDVQHLNSANSGPMAPHQPSIMSRPLAKNLEATTTTSPVTQTVPRPEELLNRTTGTKQQLCSGLPCVRKCCGQKQMVKMYSTAANSGGCVNKKNLNQTKLPMPDPQIYNRRRVPTKKKYVRDFQIIAGVHIVHQMNAFMMEDYYVIEDGTLMLDRPNNWIRWVVVDNDHFCIDYALLSTGGIVLGSFVPPDQEQEGNSRNLIVATVAMMISSMFLVATLFVYSYVPRLRNLHGKVLMAYAASLLGFFLTQSLLYIVHEIDPVNGSNMAFCHVLGLPSYFSILASFFWMNVMSYDIWYKFRGIIESRVINRRGENHKFLMYCLYGFGCPLGMTVIFAILNYLPMDQINKDIVTPGIPTKSCFLGGVEVLLYMYAPITVLIGANCVLFTLTALNITGLKKDAKTLRTSGTKASKRQFLVHAKIFSLMGLSWLLDVISTTNPKMFLWYFVDVYNFMLGVFIFFIFVGKKRILDMVTNRYRERTGTLPSRTSRIRNVSSASSTITEQSDGEHESVTYPVNFNPKARESKATLLT